MILFNRMTRKREYKNRKFKFRDAVFVYMLLLSIFILLIVVSYSYINISSMLFNNFEKINMGRLEQFNMQFDNNINTLKLIVENMSSDTYIRNSIEEYTKSSSEYNQMEIKNNLVSYMNNLKMSNPHIAEFYIINENRVFF